MSLTVPWSDSSTITKTLDIRGPRGGLTKEKATEFVTKILNGEDKDTDRVILSTWALSQESAEVLSNAISQLTLLKSAVFADIIAGRPENEGLAIYRILGNAFKDKHQLLEIDLSDNAMGQKGVDACRGILENQKILQRIFFCNDGISAEAARSIADILMNSGADIPVSTGSVTDTLPLPPKKATTLRVVHFDNNMSGGEGAKAIADIVANSPALEDFRFSSSRATRDGGVILARAFQYTPNIRSINLYDNLLAHPTGIELGTVLRSLKNLVHLNIGDTLLKDEGMIALASGLVRGPVHSLEVLNVSANEMTAEGAKAVARCVRRLTNLKVLHAQENEFDDEGVQYIGHAIYRRIAFRARAKAGNMKTVTNISASATVATDNASSSATASTTTTVTTVSGSIENDPLTEIDLSDCMMSNVGMRIIVRACSSRKLINLTRLNFEGNDVTTNGVQQVKKILAKGGISESVLGDLEDNVDDDDDEPADDEEGEELDDVNETAGATADEGESDLEPDATTSKVDVDTLTDKLSNLNV